MTIRDDIIECQCQIPALIELYPRYFPDNERRRFVEVGAFDGFHWSNTYPLVNLGWSGLLFEPLSEYYEMCKQRYAANVGITVIPCAIADLCGSVKLFPGGSMTTIAEDMLDVWNETDWIKALGMSHDRFTVCESHTLDCMLKKNNVPTTFDLLSIDVEGAEDRVLMGLDLNQHRPRMIIVELNVESNNPLIQKKVGWIKLHLQFGGYTQIHQDAINSVYWWNDVN